jgi:hypothetical protein
MVEEAPVGQNCGDVGMGVQDGHRLIVSSFSAADVESRDLPGRGAGG